MKTKPLPSTRKLRSLFDYQDGHLVYRTQRGRTAGHSTEYSKPNSVSGYIQVWVGKSLYYLHRLVWQWHGLPSIDGISLDHVNGVRHDCRVENLRPATQKQNSANRKTKRPGLTSRYVGVCLDTRNMRTWIAQIRDPEAGRVVNLGTYSTEQKALRARVKAEKKYHQDFAANLRTPLRRTTHGT